MKFNLLVLLTLFSGAVWGASDPSSSLKLKETLEQKKFEENNEITDAQLKALSGSLSRYSLTLNLSYDGPPVGNLSAEDQPNPDGSIGVFSTSLTGSMGGRYRLDPNSSVGLTAGISALTPFHGVKRTDLNNPHVAYEHNHRSGGFQLRHAMGVSSTTVPNFQKVGQVAGALYSLSLVRDLQSSPASWGLTTLILAPIYERDYRPQDGRAPRYHVSFQPNVKYNFTDRVSLYTSLRMNYWNPRSVDNEWAWQNRTLSQRVGAGFGFGRNAYLSPYLSMFPSRLAMDTTTINFAAVLSGL